MHRYIVVVIVVALICTILGLERALRTDLGSAGTVPSSERAVAERGTKSPVGAVGGRGDAAVVERIAVGVSNDNNGKESASSWIDDLAAGSEAESREAARQLWTSLGRGRGGLALEVLGWLAQDLARLRVRALNGSRVEAFVSRAIDHDCILFAEAKPGVSASAFAYVEADTPNASHASVQRVVKAALALLALGGRLSVVEALVAMDEESEVRAELERIFAEDFNLGVLVCESTLDWAFGRAQPGDRKLSRVALTSWLVHGADAQKAIGLQRAALERQCARLGEGAPKTVPALEYSRSLADAVRGAGEAGCAAGTLGVLLSSTDDIDCGEGYGVAVTTAIGALASEDSPEAIAALGLLYGAASNIRVRQSAIVAAGRIMRPDVLVATFASSASPPVSESELNNQAAFVAALHNASNRVKQRKPFRDYCQSLLSPPLAGIKDEQLRLFVLRTLSTSDVKALRSTVRSLADGASGALQLMAKQRLQDI